MLYVSIFVELLRSRPALAVWLAALAQALLWTLVPTLFYPGPPGDVPNVLAVGHEFQLGTYLGPPLAFWLAEVAFELTGRSLFGVYAAFAGLHRRHLLGGVRARPGDRRGAARGAGGAADGGRLRLRGADAGLRAGHPHHAAVGDHPAALLAGGRRGQAGILAGARHRDRSLAADHLCGADAGRPAGAVHARQ